MLNLREWDGDSEHWGQARTLNIEGTGFAAINDPELFGTTPGGEINPFTGEPMPDQSFGEAVIHLTQKLRWQRMPKVRVGFREGAFLYAVHCCTEGLHHAGPGFDQYLPDH